MRPARRPKRSVNAYFALLLALESTMIGVFAAADIFLFYVFFEVMLVPMYFLIGSYGGARRQYAAVKFFLYSLVGGLFMLAAVIGLWVLGGHTFDWETLRVGRVLPGRRALAVPRLLHRLRHQGAVLPVPHLAARRRWRGPGRGGRAAGRRARQGRHVRHPALLPAAVPERVEVLRAAGPGAGPDRHHLRRPARGRSERPQAAGRRTRRWPTSASSASASSRCTTPAGSGAVLYMVNHGLATGLLFLVVGHAGEPPRLGPWWATSAAPASYAAGAGRRPLPRRPGLAGAAGHRRRSSASSWCWSGRSR